MIFLDIFCEKLPKNDLVLKEHARMNLIADKSINSSLWREGYRSIDFIYVGKIAFGGKNDSA